MPTHCRRCCSRNAEWNCLNVYSQTLWNKQLVYRWAFPLQKFFQMFIFKDESKHLLASSSLPSHVMCLPGISLTRLTSMIELKSVTCLNTDCGKNKRRLVSNPRERRLYYSFLVMSPPMKHRDKQTTTENLSSLDEVSECKVTARCASATFRNQYWPTALRCFTWPRSIFTGRNVLYLTKHIKCSAVKRGVEYLWSRD